MTEIVSQNSSNGNLDLESFKSMFYKSNAKPDTTIKIFKEPKKIQIGNIFDINERICEKLNNHEVIAGITTVDIMFKKGRATSFGFWKEFERTNWDNIADTIESISIKWDIQIKMPNYVSPQRHTVKLRIGSDVRPSEYFQMMFASDDDMEVEMGRAFAVCKVDFVNTIIANEIIGIIENWYECLNKTFGKSFIQNFIENRRDFVARLSQHLVSFLGVVLLYIIFKLNFSAEEQALYVNLYFWIIMILIAYYITDLIGGEIARKINSLTYKLNDPKIFEITKGDKNAQLEIQSKNRGILWNIFLWFLLELLASVISIAVGHYLVW